MATAATQAAPYPDFGPFKFAVLSGTTPSDASSGLYWDICWAQVLAVIPIANATATTFGPFSWGYSAGRLTVYGANNAAQNSAPVKVLVVGRP